MRFEVPFTDENEAAILEALCLDDEERPAVRRGICREYIQNGVTALLRRLRENEDPPAVNHHDALIAALRDILGLANGLTSVGYPANGIADRARAVLAAVEGKP
jgi:hypothetical protein